MKANKLQKIWIVTRSLWLTFAGSFSVLWHTWMGTWNRAKTDKMLQKWATKLLKTVKLSYEVFNPHQITLEPEHCYIIMSNHASLYDIPLILKTFPNSIRMIAKKELFKVPIWGKAMKQAEFISIDRDNKRQAIKDLETAQQKMRSGIIPWIAPEGTRTRTGKLGSFKKGGFMLAQKTGATIIPVGIRGSYEVLPPKTLDFNLNAHVTLHIGQPIEISNYSPTDRLKFMQDVETSIRELINEPK